MGPLFGQSAGSQRAPNVHFVSCGFLGTGPFNLLLMQNVLLQCLIHFAVKIRARKMAFPEMEEPQDIKMKIDAGAV
jgi:hypothetical protein